MMKFWLFILCVFLSACHFENPSQISSHSDGTHVFAGSAMTMAYKILIGHPLNLKDQISIESIIQTTFHETHTIFNKWNPHSELSKLNTLKAQTPRLLSNLLLRLFQETDQIVNLSNGRFDPTIEPLQSLWKHKLNQGTVPSQEEIDNLNNAIGWGKIHFEGGVFFKDHEDTKFDFGGIAKGLCIDLLVERLVEAGFTNHYVEWGGEIRATGTHPQGRPWTIYISRLEDTTLDNAIATVALKDQAIATSGDYLQNWTIKTKDSFGNQKLTTYFHIFDPKSKQPLETSYHSIASVSVVADNCAFADGLATISMMFSTPLEAEEWAATIQSQYPNTQFWIISRAKN